MMTINMEVLCSDLVDLSDNVARKIQQWAIDGLEMVVEHFYVCFSVDTNLVSIAAQPTLKSREM